MSAVNVSLIYEMELRKEALKNLLSNEKCNNLTSLLDSLSPLFHCSRQPVESMTLDLIDRQFLAEVNSVNSHGIIPVYFGKTLRDLKCLIMDEEGLREHEIILRYKGPNKLVVVSVPLPHSPLQDLEYSSLEEIVNTFKRHIDSLAGYFHELERIDRYCTVMDPVHPTFKEDYRRILLDDRIWLHVEVTSEGIAKNIHLVGQSEQWQDQLQTGLLNWDHDRDIVENVMTIFDITDFPALTNTTAGGAASGDGAATDSPACCICLCTKLIDDPGVPQPLCQNPMCGVYFHRNCLFQWLVACAGGRPPPFGVATGSCPTCLQSITCDQKDN